MKIVLRIGGSVLGSPPNAPLLNAYASVIHKVLDRGHRIALVVGGGNIARQYIDAAKGLGLPSRDQDTVAIQVSRLNAKLVGIKLGVASVQTDVRRTVSRLARYNLAVMGGLRPGITTDTVATLVAEAWRSDILIKASDQAGIYSSDPRHHPDAKLLSAVSHRQLVEILGGKHSPGIHSIVDPVAVQHIARHGIRLVVIDGTSPGNVLSVVEGKAVGTTVS